MCEFANKMFDELSANFIEESSEDALVRNREQFIELSTLGRLEVTPMFRAFVVGHEVDEKTMRDKNINGDGDGVLRAKIQAVTYNQLTRSANKRLFKLKDNIPSRYDEVTGGLMAKVMQTPSQSSL